MSKIKEGEYVRTEKGIIGKFKGYSLSIIFANDDIVLDHCIIGFDEDDIKAHSKNIIDLIEVGDYVNGYKVDDIEYGKLIIGDTTQVVEQILDDNEDIKTIVTKELFNSVMYKVVE